MTSVNWYSKRRHLCPSLYARILVGCCLVDPYRNYRRLGMLWNVRHWEDHNNSHRRIGPVAETHRRIQ